MGSSQKFGNAIAVVTGATGGIGRTTALAFASHGASLALLSRNRDRLNSLADEIREKYHRESLILSVDVRSSSEIQAGIERVVDRHGRIDYLVNSAGIIAYKPFLELSHEEFHEMMAVNYFGTVACIRAVLPAMLRQGTGHVVNIASTAGRRGFPMETGYCGSKFAVMGFSEALRMELHGTGVGISVISPGIVDTSMARNFLNLPGIRQEVQPLSPDQIASWVLKVITEKRPEVILPFSTRMVIRLNSMAPRIADWIIRHRVKRITRVISKSSGF